MSRSIEPHFASVIESVSPAVSISGIFSNSLLVLFVMAKKSLAKDNHPCVIHRNLHFIEHSDCGSHSSSGTVGFEIGVEMESKSQLLKPVCWNK